MISLYHKLVGKLLHPIFKTEKFPLNTQENMTHKHFLIHKNSLCQNFPIMFSRSCLDFASCLNVHQNAFFPTTLQRSLHFSPGNGLTLRIIQMVRLESSSPPQKSVQCTNCREVLALHRRQCNKITLVFFFLG